MAFRITPGRPVSDQLRRIVREELRAALEELGGARPDQDAIHEARKSVKKSRAVLRLLEPALKSRYTVENARLRTAAHALSALRDADATLDTLRGLHGQYPSALRPSVTRAVARGLRTRKRRARVRTVRTLPRARGALERSEQSAPRHIGRAADSQEVRSGAVRGYRRAHQALTGLCVDSEAARFHLWRKRLKDHWYHVRLFAGLHSAPRGRARTLERLETLLGDDHDLVMLRTLLLDAAERYGDARTTALVLGCITKSQASLRKRALALGHRTFAQRPEEFGESVDTWWRRHKKGK